VKEFYLRAKRYNRVVRKTEVFEQIPLRNRNFTAGEPKVRWREIAGLVGQAAGLSNKSDNKVSPKRQGGGKICPSRPRPVSFLSILLILFPVFAVSLFPGCSFDYGSPLYGGEEIPDIIMNDVEYVRVRDGDPQVRFKAELAERYEESRVMELKNFSFEQFERHGGEVNAAGSAGRAHVELDSGNIDLAGGVALAVESEDIVIETGELAWKDKERDLSGDASGEVKINRANGTSFSGWGFRANARSRTWGFSRGIRGTYIHDDEEEDASGGGTEAGDIAESGGR
jgi:LPS export ABC transporter protein LptC